MPFRTKENKFADNLRECVYFCIWSAIFSNENAEQTCQKTDVNKHSYLNPKNKDLHYKCIIRPILTYASPVWYTAANYHLKRLQITQNKCLKIINNKNLKYPTIILYIRKLNMKKYLIL